MNESYSLPWSIISEKWKEISLHTYNKLSKGRKKNQGWYNDNDNFFYWKGKLIMKMMVVEIDNHS